MKSIDKDGIFAEPVQLEEVEGYAAIITEPMDFGTMQMKIDAIGAVKEKIETQFTRKRKLNAVEGYNSVAEFRRDLRLVIENCLTWNIEGSHFFNNAKSA